MENEQNKIRSEISLLTKRLNELNAEKKQKINEITEIKKEIRRFLDNLKALINSLKGLRDEKTIIEKKTKNKTRINPLDLKKRIESIEEKIQTEVISFDKEKKLMGELKKLKADFKDSGDLFFNRDKISSLSKEIKEERDKANEFHNKIRSLLDSNKEKNKEFKGFFKELDNLREKESIKQKEISEIKTNIENLNVELNSKLSAVGQIKKNLVNEAVKRKEYKKKMDEKIIEEKSKIVEDKIKNKVKLTKEDFLIYQSQLNKNDE